MSLIIVPSNPDSRIQFRDIRLADWLDEYAGRDRRSQVAKQMIDRYRLILDDGLRYARLTEDEAIDLWSVVNGCNLSHAEQLPILWNSIISELREQEKDVWIKVQTWRLPTWIAALDACQRVGWGSCSIHDLPAELARVGLLDQ